MTDITIDKVEYDEMQAELARYETVRQEDAARIVELEAEVAQLFTWSGTLETMLAEAHAERGAVWQAANPPGQELHPVETREAMEVACARLVELRVQLETVTDEHGLMHTALTDIATFLYDTRHGMVGDRLNTLTDIVNRLDVLSTELHPLKSVAKTYYVDEINGDDANSGLSADKAFATHDAARAAVEKSAASRPPNPPIEVTIVLGGPACEKCSRPMQATGNQVNERAIYACDWCRHEVIGND